MNLKKISKLLSLSIILFNCNTVSYSNSISSENRYEDFEGDSLTISDILEEDKIDLEIEGNSIVNLINIDTSQYQPIVLHTTGHLQLGNANVFKNGQTYTFIGEFSDVVGSNPFCLNFNSSWMGPDINIKPENGLVKFKFTIPTNSPIRNDSRVVAYYFDSGNSCKVRNIMILEGDWTDRRTPEYFRGILSVGQDNINGHNLKVTSTSRNVLDANIKQTDIYREVEIVEYTNGSSDTINLNLSQPLRGISDSVKDRIIKKDRRWVIERKCGEIKLNGSEDWGFYRTTDSNTISFLLVIDNGVSFKPRPSIVIQHFKGMIQEDFFELEDVNSEWSFYNSAGNPMIFINIYRHRLENPTVDSLKKWLSNNPISLVYELNNPIYEELNTDISIKTYLDSTSITNNSIVPTNIKTTIDRVINIATKYTSIAKDNPSIENIANARYWTNLIKESLKKDELQNNINDIYKLDELKINKKDLTNSSDIYISPLNTLSLSINTNHVIFDEYSNVESLEMLNALELAISSSLPYDISAYLDSDIISEDKSSILNPNILNIKDGKDTTYKTFTQTKDKVTLKTNLNAGQYNIHNIDLKLDVSTSAKPLIYKTSIKFEIEQK